jgi:hypothetical protein
MLARVPNTHAVSFYTRWPQPAPFIGQLRDVSLNGMLLQSGVRLRANQVVKIDCTICRALARVAHCRRDPDGADQWLVGLEFITLRFANKRGSFVSAQA